MAQQPPPSASSYAPGYPAQVATELAGFWRRFGAYIIDAVILAVIAGILQAIVNAIARVSTSDTTSISISGGIIALVLYLVYFGYLWSRYGQTVGYLALNMRLVRVDGAPIGLGTSVARAFLVWLSFAICLIPAIISAFMIGLGRQKQAIHDVMVGTIVVRT